MKFSLYFAAAMLTWLLPSFSHAQNVQGTVTGNSIQLTITGGYLPVTYLWSNGSTQEGISNLANGRYCVTVTDALCGTASQCFDINEPCVLKGVTIKLQKAPCPNTSNGSICAGITVAPGTFSSKGYTFLWNTGATTACITAGSGTYSVTITSNKGCIGKASYILRDPEPATIAETVTEACKTDDGLGAIQLTVTPTATSYTWSNGATTQNISGLQPATYSVTVTDANDCTQTKAINVTQASMMGDVVVAKVKNNTDCPDRRPCTGSTRGDGGIELEVIRPRNYTYSWSGTTTGLPNAPIASGLCQGSYDVDIFITNVPACRLSLSENVCCCVASANEPFSCNRQQPLSVELEPKSPSTPSSADGQIELLLANGTGNHKIKWTLPDNTIIRGQRTLTGLSQAGKYCVTVNDGCDEETKCVELEICSNIAINISELVGKTCDCTISPDCNAGKIQLTSVTGGITPHKFKWSNGKTTRDIEDLPKGNYTVTVTTASGCSQTKSFTVGAVATTFALNTSDCRWYDEVCPVNNKVVKSAAKSAPVLQKNVLNLRECTIEDICINNQRMLVEALIEVSETRVYNGRCATLVYCKSISRGTLYTKSITNIDFERGESYIDRSYCGTLTPVRVEQKCNGRVVGYTCEPLAGPNGESITNKNDDKKDKTYLFDLLDSMNKTDNALYFVPKSVNEKTRVAEFEKLMSETEVFNLDDFKEYKTLKGAKNSEKAINSLMVFPNPFNQSFTIEIDNQSVSKATISVYNSLGQMVISNNHNLTKGKNVINIDAKQLNESIYIVEVVDEKGLRMTQKILKSNR